MAQVVAVHRTDVLKAKLLEKKARRHEALHRLLEIAGSLVDLVPESGEVADGVLDVLPQAYS